MIHGPQKGQTNKQKSKQINNKQANKTPEYIPTSHPDQTGPENTAQTPLQDYHIHLGFKVLENSNNFFGKFRLPHTP